MWFHLLLLQPYIMYVSICSHPRILSVKRNPPSQILSCDDALPPPMRTNTEGHQGNISLPMTTKSADLPTHQSESVLTQCCLWAIKNSLPPPKHPLRKQDCSEHAKPHWERITHTDIRVTDMWAKNGGVLCQGGKLVVYPLPQPNRLRKDVPLAIGDTEFKHVLKYLRQYVTDMV